MKAFVVAVVLLCLSISPAARADSPDDQYVNIYALIEQGDTLSDKGNADGARAKYAEAQKQLKQLQLDNPRWNTKTVKYRLDYLAGKLAGAGSGTTVSQTVDTAPPPGVNPADPVEMKIKWQVGKSYLEQVDMAMTMDLNVPGAPKPMKQETTAGQIGAIKVVKESDNGGRELKLVMQGIRMTSKMDGKTMMSFDSKKDSAKDGANPMSKVAGMEVKIVLDGTGNIESIAGAGGSSKEGDVDSAAGKEKLINGVLTESTIKEFVDEGKDLPPKPIKIGDTWTVNHESEAGQLGTVVFSLTNKFKGWEKHNGHQCVVYECVGTMSSKGGDAAGAVDVKIENGKFTSKEWFDPNLGRAIEISGQIVASTTIEAQGQKIAAKMTILSGKKLLEITDAK